MTPTAAQFAQTFVESYLAQRNLFSGEAWSELWTNRWNTFILWNPSGPQTKTVLSETAERLGLTYWEREPFRLDGAFLEPEAKTIGNYRVPITVAIEHENDVRTFDQEIAKLFQIRCPLKVGITYLLGPVTAGQQLERWQNQIKTHVVDISQLLNHSVVEDPRTEYCLLLGHEREGLILEWWAATFGSDPSPLKVNWARLTPRM